MGRRLDWVSHRAVGVGLPCTRPNGESTIAIDQVHESVTNPRQTFEQSKLEELAESIRQHGLIQLITVRPNNNGFEIVAGARRFRAAQLAELFSFLVRIVELDDAKAMEWQLPHSTAKTPPVAGACVTCPRRSGHNTSLFCDVQGDQCLDAPCYHGKVEAFLDREIAAKPELVQIENGWLKAKEQRPGAVQLGHVREIETRSENPDAESVMPCAASKTAIVVYAST